MNDAAHEATLTGQLRNFYEKRGRLSSRLPPSKSSKLVTPEAIFCARLCMTNDSSPLQNSNAPNFTLDPQGLHGTSTARRARQSRQKRQLRAFAFALLLFIGVGALAWFWLQPRAQGFAVVSTRILPLDLNAPATLDSAGNLWLASQSGALWRVDANGQNERYGAATTGAAPPFVSAGGGVYVPGLDGTLTAFSAPGTAHWTRDLGNALSTTPALWRAGDAVILAVGDSDGNVFGLNANDGQKVWSAQLGGPIGSGLVATREGFVAPTLASGIWRGGLIGLDGKTGRINWRYPADRKMAAGTATPLFDANNNRVYWNNDEGTVASLDASSGRVRWQSEVAPADAPQSEMLRARPALFGQSLLVGGGDGILRSLDASNGKMRWSVDLGSPIRALSAANFGGHPAVLVTSERDIILVDASGGKFIQRDSGTAAWLLSGGKDAIVVGENGSWRRVNW